MNGPYCWGEELELFLERKKGNGELALAVEKIRMGMIGVVQDTGRD